MREDDAEGETGWVMGKGKGGERGWWREVAQSGAAKGCVRYIGGGKQRWCPPCFSPSPSILQIPLCSLSHPVHLCAAAFIVHDHTHAGPGRESGGQVGIGGEGERQWQCANGEGEVTGKGCSTLGMARIYVFFQSSTAAKIVLKRE